MVKLKKISKDKIDRISNLPNHLISQILSLLPTKNAMATSILSTRWKFLWTSITTLTFDDKTIYSRHKMKRTKFAVFINKVFILIPPFHIQNFRLKCSPEIFDPLHLHMWISLIASTVRQLDLHLGSYRFKLVVLKLEPFFQLQMNHFRFNKLVVLKLQGGIGFKIPAHASVCFPSLQTLHLSGTNLSIASNSSVSFPYLTILHLYSVTYADKESVHKLFSGCPVLHSLYINFYHWAKPCLTICIPSLARLEINISGYGNCDCEIQIDKFCQLEFLSIYDRALKVNGKSWPTISSGFHFLKRLELEVDCCRKFSDVIKHLLERMDNLEHLGMKRTYVRCNCSQKSWWIEPLNVAECLLSRVTSISFTRESGMMDDCHDELELIRYLLKNARVMKLLKLGIPERKHEMIQKISAFPKGPQSCKIEWT